MKNVILDFKISAFNFKIQTLLTEFKYQMCDDFNQIILFPRPSEWTIYF